MTNTPAVTTPEPTAENPNPVAPETSDVEDPTLLGPEQTTDSPKDKDVSEAPKGDEEKKVDGEEKKEEEISKEVPEKYEIKPPEGMTIDAKSLDAFTPIFKALGLSNQAVQKLTDEVYVPLIQSVIDSHRQSSMKEYKSIVDGWKVDTQKALGTEAKTSLAACGRALNKFGTPELREMLQETGVGNHIQLVRFMEKVGKLISEDTLVDSSTQPKGSADDGLKKMYPSMFS